MKVRDVVQGLRAMISDDCCNTQYDYLDEIEAAIKILEDLYCQDIDIYIPKKGGKMDES